VTRQHFMASSMELLMCCAVDLSDILDDMNWTSSSPDDPSRPRFPSWDPKMYYIPNLSLN